MVRVGGKQIFKFSLGGRPRRILRRLYPGRIGQRFLMQQLRSKGDAFSLR
jgi:hypothetical protein